MNASKILKDEVKLFGPYRPKRSKYSYQNRLNSVAIRKPDDEAHPAYAASETFSIRSLSSFRAAMSICSMRSMCAATIGSLPHSGGGSRLESAHLRCS